MYKLRQILLTAFANFRRWKKNPQIILAFCLAFIVSFLLSDKVLVFAKEHDTILQMAEPFIWTFGDAQSVLIISLLLLLLFADMPNLGNDVPLFLVRIDRKVWVLGQILYLILATFLFLCFILLSTCILASSQAFVANMWSDTAAVLGYSNIGYELNVPSFVKVMELNFPYQVMFHIFGLMLGYSIVMAGIILFFNMVKDNGGMIAGIIYSGFGFLLTRIHCRISCISRRCSRGMQTSYSAGYHRSTMRRITCIASAMIICRNYGYRMYFLQGWHF